MSELQVTECFWDFVVPNSVCVATGHFSCQLWIRGQCKGLSSTTGEILSKFNLKICILHGVLLIDNHLPI